jgi:hypothetical protein
MTDKELLELAAKSIGLKYRPENNYVVVDAKTGQWLGSWNPLTDDGDALRLAVKLKLSVKNTDIRASVIVENQTGWFIGSEPHVNDPYAATRRVIARAAAEIGKAKCE